MMLWKKSLPALGTSPFIVHNMQHAYASGLLDCVGDALSLFGVDSVLDQDSVLRVEGQPVLVGVGTDGASECCKTKRPKRIIRLMYKS